MRDWNERNIRLQTVEGNEVHRSGLAPVGEWLQKNERTRQLKETEVLVSDEDGSESDLLDLTGRLGTRMKCFQREVEATDERIVKAKKLSSVSPRSPKRKKRRKKR